MRSSSEGDVDGLLSESLELELIEGGRSGLAGAWLPCSMLLVVLALAGVLPVAELLPELKFGGISSESLDECIGGGLERELLRRLELDDSDDRAHVAPLEDAVCAVCVWAVELGTVEYNEEVVDVEEGCDDELFADKLLDEACGTVVTVAAADDCCCWFCIRYCCKNWIANRGSGKLIGS